MNRHIKRTLTTGTLVLAILGGLGACTASDDTATPVTTPKEEVKAEPTKKTETPQKADDGLNKEQYVDLVTEHMQLTSDGLGYFGEFYTVLSQDFTMVTSDEALSTMIELEKMFDATVESAESFLPPDELQSFHDEYVDILRNLRAAVYLANEGAREMDAVKMAQASEDITAENTRIYALVDKIK